MSDGLDPIPPDPDAEGCLCLVASYVNAAPLLQRVTMEAANRIMMSPAAGDFIELRFADLGPQPGLAGERSRAVQRIITEMMSPRFISGRNYFALVVIDRSAAVVEQVLSGCAATASLAALRVRFLGIASVDDRSLDDRGPTSESGPSWDIVTSPSGAWRRESDLIDLLRRQGDNLLRYFATRKEPGLSPDELADLKGRYERYSASESDSGASASETSMRDAGPGPDLLAAGPVSAPDRGTQQGARHKKPEPEDRQPRDPQADEDERTTGEELESEEEPPVEGEPARRPSRILSRWLPEVRWRLRQREQDQEDGGDMLSAEPDTRALVYLLITGADAFSDRTWNRSRTALLEVDRKIAATPGITCQVRALHGDEDALRGELREAGRLTRRDVKHPVADVDFAVLLERIRAVLRRDRALTSASGGAAVRSAVVFFTPDPPLADTVTAEVFAELSREAYVTWVVPRESEGLVAPALREVPGAHVLTDYQAVANEVIGQLNGGADILQVAAEPRLARPARHPPRMPVA